MTLFLIFLFFSLVGFWIWYEKIGKWKEKEKIVIERKTYPQVIEKEEEIFQKVIPQKQKREPEKPLISEPPQKKALPPSNLPTV